MCITFIKDYADGKSRKKVSERVNLLYVFAKCPSNAVDFALNCLVSKVKRLFFSMAELEQSRRSFQLSEDNFILVYRLILAFYNILTNSLTSYRMEQVLLKFYGFDFAF